MSANANAGIVVENLQVQLGGQPILRGVSLAMRPGEVTAIVGPNGAGKSTLLKAVAGLLVYDGDIRYGEAQLAELSHARRARLAAYVPQRSELSAALTVGEVVAMGRYAHNPERSTLSAQDSERVAAALAEVDVTDLADRAYTRLSGGEQRRVLLARALATDAPTILLDEPTASLDIGHTLQLHATLRTLAQRGRTIVVVMHALNDVRVHTDRAYLLSEGAVVGSGSSADVIGAQLVREIYGVELVEGDAAGFRTPNGEPPS